MLNAIATTMCEETYPGIDGSSNAERVEFICEVMGLDSLDLSERIDVTDITSSKEWDVVEAGRQMLLLQIDFMRRCALLQAADAEECATRISELTLEVQRVQWHKKHLEQGKTTPPFPFFGV